MNLVQLFRIRPLLYNLTSPRSSVKRRKNKSFPFPLIYDIVIWQTSSISPLTLKLPNCIGWFPYRSCFWSSSFKILYRLVMYLHCDGRWNLSVLRSSIRTCAAVRKRICVFVNQKLKMACYWKKGHLSFLPHPGQDILAVFHTALVSDVSDGGKQGKNMNQLGKIENSSIRMIRIYLSK